MLRGTRTAVAATALLVVVAALYLTRLSFSPIYLIHDEVKFSLQAESIAESGRDLNGRLLPVYFSEPEFKAGRDPIMIYATAAALTLVPLSQAAVRFPTALVGVVTCLLMFFVARRLFKSDGLGLIAAGLLALTPGHFMHSRMALSIAYPLPFILAWLWTLEGFLERQRPRALFNAGAWLGASIYSYLGCVVMSPIYLVFTIASVMHRKPPSDWRKAAPAIAGFGLLLMPAIAWQIAYPDRFEQLVSGYRLADGSHHAGLTGLMSLQGLRTRADLFWTFFDPSFLFLSGDSSLINSTREVGFFPVVFAVLLPVGIVRVIRARGWPLSLVILGGFITAPIAAVLSGELETNRVLYVLPFGALLATYGVEAMFQARTPALRWLGIALLVAVPWQFATFYADYTGGYRTRTSSWFGGNLPGALDAVIQRTPDTILLSREIPYVDSYWRFAAIAARRHELIDRVTYVDGDSLPNASAGALLVCAAGPRACEAVKASPDWLLVTSSSEPDGQRLFDVYQRR